MTTPKLLMADDSVTIRKVVELTFADEGVDVFAVADGEAAMQKFIEVQPDIVLVDVEMPGPNGYQICEMIKQDEATKHIPVLLLVGSFEPFDHDEAERVGADGFLTKPFQSIRELVARVSELLHPSEEQPESETRSSSVEPDDIEELYQSSFASTKPIEEYGTEDHVLVDSSFDGESIDEAPAIEPRIEHEPFGDSSIVSSDAGEESIADGSTTEESENVDETLSETSLPITDSDEPFFDDTGFDDEMIETVRPDGGGRSNGFEIVTAAQQPEEFVSASEPADDHETVKDFDWSPAAKITEYTDPESVVTGFEPRFSFSESDATIEMHPADGDSHGLALVDGSGAEPSGEFIALIAKRVVEKLSDHVIREIAQEAVPRIAEKLIREALDEDKKG